ncbi:MAG: hydroxymethylbilane synthase [Thaumarchaeota archaeon]|nr:hydroxymethylbilane synthase [Nitrososphaerota archaeon]
MKGIRIGTRKSRLAIAQTDIVTGMIRSRFPAIRVEVVPMNTAGDRLPLERRAEVEGKAVFTEEVEIALIGGAIDLAVHSMKDLPNELAEGLAIGATPARGDVRDVLVAKKDGSTISTLRRGAVIGTSSIRRKAQLRSMRDDISVVDLHGNVDTRLLRIERENLDAIVIAAAGLERLGESRRISQYFSPHEMVPAPCQGAIAVEVREEDEYVGSLLSGIDDERVRAETTCERSFARALGGDCDVPAGASAALDAGTLKLSAIILSPDGGTIVKGSATSEVTNAEGLGTQLARQLLRDGGDELLRGARNP